MATRVHTLALVVTALLAAACANPFTPAPPDVVEAPLPATAAPRPATAVTPDVPLALARWDEDGDLNTLLAVHPLTGEPVPGRSPIDLGSHFTTALSPDGRTVAVLSFPDEHSELDGRLRLIDLEAWSVRDAAITVDGYPGLFQYTADGLSLLLAETGDRLQYLSRFDARSGQRVAEVDLGFFPRQAAVTPDSAGLMVYGTSSPAGNGLNPAAHVALLDAHDLAPRWQLALPEVLDGQYLRGEALEPHDNSIWYLPATVWAPGQPWLYIVHADQDRLTIVNFDAQSVASRPIAPAQSWLDRLMAFTAGVAEAKMVNGTQKHAAISPAGDRLYVLGFTVDSSQQHFTETPLGLSVVDPFTGQLLAHLNTESRSFSLALGGHLLILETGGEHVAAEVRRAVDLGTVVRTMPGVRLLSGRIPGSQPLLLAVMDQPTETRFQVLDPASFDALGAWSVPGVVMPILLP
jgi:hypothetical protein